MHYLLDLVAPFPLHGTLCRCRNFGTTLVKFPSESGQYLKATQHSPIFVIVSWEDLTTD